MAIVHVPGWLFSQNLVHVYKDGHLVKTAPLRCPSLTEVRPAGFGGTWTGGGGLCSPGGLCAELHAGGPQAVL